MRVRLLGTAAGGGFPQWNCHCNNCQGVRSGTIQAYPRTQSCVAISGDDQHWFLLNASPDIRQHIESFAPLRGERATRRGSAIEGILLTDADLDHTLGLFLLREGEPLSIYASSAVQNALTQGLRLGPTLEHYCGLLWHEPAHELTPLPCRDGSDSNLYYQGYMIAGKSPRYMKNETPAQAGNQLGYRIVDKQSGASLLFLPGLAHLDEQTRRYMRECHLLLLDGTFWSEHEMEEQQLGKRTASQMGHLPVGGPQGSLTYVATLPIPHKVYTHINNTNPMLIEGSPEWEVVKAAGVTIAWDGLEFTL